MGTEDRIENRVEDAKGHAKEWVGDATDNERLEAEGKLDQGKAKAKDFVEDIKDKAHDAVDRNS